MALFKDIVNESLLTEITQDRYGDIKKAINNVLRVRMGYNDKKGGKGKNERYILPVAFGLTKSGKPAVRAYQTAGSSKRGLTTPPNNRKIPKWKLFLVDNIYSWSNGSKSFKDYKDTLINLGLNTHGDKSMTTLFAITPFADDNVQVAKNTSPITPEPVTKLDVTPSTASQNPQTTDTEKFEPASISRQMPIDNRPEQIYNEKSITAPETKPVAKNSIVNEPSPAGEKESGENLLAPDTAPIDKNYVNGIESKDDVKAKFDDMMNRMNNLNKDEDENANQ